MSTVIADLPRPADQRLPLYAIRWGAIFAGLAVGLSVHLLLMLLGVAGGLTALDARESAPDAGNAALIAGIWNTVAMLAAAYIGGYVAARACGLKRNADGLLHGAVTWGATTILTAALATSTIGSAVGGAFSALKPAVANVASTATEQLAQRAGIDTGTQAEQGGTPNVTQNVTQNPQVQEKAKRAMDNASATMWWLFGAVLLSLIAGLIGGAVGVKAAANRFRTSRRADHRNDLPRNDVPLRPDFRTDFPPRHDGPIVR